MSKVLVIGYGNPLRSDDSFGLRAVEALEKELNGKDVEFVECHQLTPELAERIAKAERVIFVDSSTDGIAGSVHCQRIGPPRGKKKSDAIVHHVDPAQLLGLSDSLYHKVPEAMLVTVTGECFGYGTQLTTHVANALPGVVHHLKELVEEKCAGELARA